MRGSGVCLAVTLVALLVVVTGAWSGDERREVLLREEFDSLTRWEELTFPKIPRKSRYSISTREDGGSSLRAESSASASGLVYAEEFSVYNWPGLRWRWRTDKVYRGGDARRKEGDDYPLRLYVLFLYEPEVAGFREKIIFEAARLLHGDYPPHSALNYIWANREHDAGFLPNAYTGRAMMIVRRGPDDAGSWHEEDVDIVDDYRKAFGREPPPRARLAVMNDSDNTGESSVSFIDFIVVYR